MKKVRVLIADDHNLFRLGVITLLKTDPRFEIVGEVSDGEQAITAAIDEKPDVVVMDIHLPHIDGIAATNRILRVLPDTKILALTTLDQEENILAMINAGALGYVIKDASTSELMTAISTVTQGNTYFSKLASSALLASLTGKEGKRAGAAQGSATGQPRLTKREFEILRMVAEERGNQEIADTLFISPRTVETHKRNLILKLKVKNVVGLARFYFKHFSSSRGA